jgi:hypothetical protein
MLTFTILTVIVCTSITIVAVLLNSNALAQIASIIVGTRVTIVTGRCVESVNTVFIFITVIVGAHVIIITYRHTTGTAVALDQSHIAAPSGATRINGTNIPVVTVSWFRDAFSVDAYPKHCAFVTVITGNIV